MWPHPANGLFTGGFDVSEVFEGRSIKPFLPQSVFTCRVNPSGVALFHASRRQPRPAKPSARRVWWMIWPEPPLHVEWCATVYWYLLSRVGYDNSVCSAEAEDGSNFARKWCTVHVWPVLCCTVVFYMHTHAMYVLSLSLCNVIKIYDQRGRHQHIA